MSFGEYIAGGVATQMARILLAVFVAGAVIGLGGYFGISWLIENVSVTVK